MASSKQMIISDVGAYVANNGASHSQWYVGIATNPRQRLFNDHAVKEKGDAWIYRQCVSSDDARAIEKYFIGLGMKGGPGGGDDDSDYACAYKITPTTKESN